MKKLYDKYLYIFGLLMPMFILYIKGTSLVYVLSIIFILLCIIEKKGKIKYSIKKLDKIYIAFICISALSTISAIVYNQPKQWKWQAIVFFIYSVLLMALYFLLNNETTVRIQKILFGLRTGLLLNVIYGYIQYTIYLISGSDINQIIFGKLLKTASTTSHYSFGKLVPTGFTWHPGAYAPVLVAAYCMFYNNIIVKILVIGIAFLARSSTCTLGIIICVLFELIKRIKKMNAVFRKRVIISTILITLLAAFLMFITGIGKIAISEIQRLIIRTQNTSAYLSSDFSTYYHTRYFTGLGEVINHANLLQILFGVGGGCSGYAFMRVFGQYVGLAPWDVESQIIVDLICYGIVGFLLLSIWSIRIVKKALKIDFRYIVFLVSTFFMYFTYNIRFPWVLIFLFIMIISIKRGLIVWERKTKKDETNKRSQSKLPRQLIHVGYSDSLHVK